MDVTSGTYTSPDPCILTRSLKTTPRAIQGSDTFTSRPGPRRWLDGTPTSTKYYKRDLQRSNHHPLKTSRGSTVFTLLRSWRDGRRHNKRVTPEPSQSSDPTTSSTTRLWKGSRGTESRGTEPLGYRNRNSGVYETGNVERSEWSMGTRDQKTRGQCYQKRV